MKKTNRLTALLLVLVMLCTAMAATITVNAATNITSASDFNAISDGGTYTLTADITISATLPAKSNITFDGNGHTITLSAGMTSGVFAKLTGSTLKNLTVKAPTSSPMTFTGATGEGVAGVVATIDNCTLENVTNNANISTTSSTAWFGGVVGNVYGSTLKNCVNNGNLAATAGEYMGGVAGVNFTTSAYSGCKNFGTLNGKAGDANNDVGGIIGYVYSNNSHVTLTDCVSFGTISVSGDKSQAGAFVGRNDSTACITKIENCLNFTETPAFGSNAVAINVTADRSISSAAQLSSLVAGGAYTVTADFDCPGGYTLPVGAVIEGGGHTITLKNASSGLFKIASEAIVQNLTIAGEINASANGSGSIGAFANTLQGALTLKNVNNTASINVTGTGYDAAGGFIGAVASNAENAKISACNNYGDITAKAGTAEVIGGVIGLAATTFSLSSCSNHGTLTGANVGGILGKASGDASKIKLSADNNYGACISDNTPAIAGICGINDIGKSLTTTICNDFSNDATVKAADIKLRDEVSLRFYVYDSVFVGADKISIKTTSGHRVAWANEETVMINGVKCRAFSIFGISPENFGDKIKFTVSVTKNGTEYKGEKEYSIKDYCMTQIKSNLSSQSLKRLCVDLLNYGAEAQKLTGLAGNALVNSGLTAAQKEYATKLSPTFENKTNYSGTANASVADWTKVEADVTKEIAPTLYFTAPGGVEGMEATVTLPDGSKTVITRFESLGDNSYSLKLDGLSASVFSGVVKIVLKNASGSSRQLDLCVAASVSDSLKTSKDTALITAAIKYISSVDKYLYDTNVRPLYDVTKYDIEKYAAPVWEGNIVYAETAFIRETSKTDSSVSPISLLYPVDEIISVRSADMKTLYEEGIDYTIENGKLIIKPASEGGRIKILPYYSADHSKEAYTYPVSGEYAGTDMESGGLYYYWRDPMYTNDTEGGLAKWTISVTYKHSGTSVITKPTDQSSKFSGLMSKLTKGNDIKVVSLGDSITRGCSASLNHKMGAWGPKAPAYNQMFCDYLEAAYGVNVNHKNLAVDGKTSTWGKEAAQINAVCNENPDIFILAFGMNDGGLTPSGHAANIKTIVDSVRSKCPNAYIIVVSTCLLGQQYYYTNQSRPQFGDTLASTFASTDKVVVANVTKVDIQMEGYDTANEKNHTGPKTYQDLTGSNSNHPNDFMHRIYMQTIIQSAFGKNKFA